MSQDQRQQTRQLRDGGGGTEVWPTYCVVNGISLGINSTATPEKNVGLVSGSWRSIVIVDDDNDVKLTTKHDHDNES